MAPKATSPRVGRGLNLDDVALFLANEARTRRTLDRLDAQERLLDYTRLLWPVLEPGRKFIDGWAIGAVAEHLEAVTLGQITRLLINVPPGYSKSLMTDVFWPSWEWGPRKRPHLRYVSASYSGDLTLRDNGKCRDLIGSSLYQSHWGPQRAGPCSYMEDESKLCDCGAVFHVRKNFDARGNFKNNFHGFKLASSVGGVGTGERGDRVIIDDPHSVKQSESEAIREETLRWLTEVMASRTNDASTAFVVIMQRVHDRDASGLILSSDLGYTHLCIPQRFETNHPHRWWGSIGRCREEQTTTPTCHQMGAGDPRTEEGQLAWPELWPAERVDQTEKEMSAWGGSYAVSGQEQQRPAPRGGGLFKAKWFNIIPDSGITWQNSVRGWDFAATVADTSAWTVGARIAMMDGKIYVLDIHRKRGTPGDVEGLIDLLHRGDPADVFWSLPRDPGQSGVYQAAALSRRLQGRAFQFTPETGSKESRAEPFAAQAELGNVYLIKAHWNADLLAELSTFPAGQYKDQVDALSRAYLALVARSARPFTGMDARAMVAK